MLSAEEIKKAHGSSLIQILSQTSASHGAGDKAERSVVIGRALDILIDIHKSFVLPTSEDISQKIYSEVADSPMEDAKRRRMLHALLDLISLEGLYPSLSSGVGIPLQQRVISVLPAGIIAKKTDTVPSSVPHDEPLLRRIISVLIDILNDPRPSIQPIIRSRILSDIISGTSDLAFNPKLELCSNRKELQKALAQIVEEYAYIVFAMYFHGC